MVKIACLCLVFVATKPLWSQVAPSATGGPPSLDDTQMMTPPPVSQDAYPVIVGAETRSNFIAGAIVVTGAYNDNLMIDPTAKVGDSTYSIVPSISIDYRTPHQAESLTYTSGVTLFQNTTSLNAFIQEGSADYRRHLSRFTVLSVSDSFHQNSNLFNQANPFIGGGVSPGGSSPTSVYVYPFASQFGNSLNGDVEYQYRKNAMIGGNVSYSLLHYGSVSNTPGLNNSNVGEGSAFFSRRFNQNQYFGVDYIYSKITTNPVQTATETHTVVGFYTHYLARTISLSILGGPQHYDSRDSVSGVTYGSWTPALQGSFGYQMTHMNVTAALSRIVSSARGLAGAYHSNLASLGFRRQITRAWYLDANASYVLFKNVTPNISYFNQGGHTVTGTVFAERSIRDRISIQIGYSRFHQSYNFGTEPTLYPDCNRGFGSISYAFSRPLGR